MSKMLNAVDQTKRELMTRYDFQGTGSTIEFKRDDDVIEVSSNSELKLKTVIDVLESKLIRNEISLKVLDKSKEIQSGNMIYRQSLPLVQGLDQDKAKKVTKFIRDGYPKAKTQVQGEEVRVTSASKDELQDVMTALRAAEFDFPIDFTNFR